MGRTLAFIPEPEASGGWIIEWSSICKSGQAGRLDYLPLGFQCHTTEQHKNIRD